MRLSDKELKLLTALQVQLRRHRGQDTAWATVPDLQDDHLIEPDASPEGIHQTAASLVRKGLVRKQKIRGKVHLIITPLGTIERKVHTNCVDPRCAHPLIEHNVYGCTRMTPSDALTESVHIEMCNCNVPYGNEGLALTS